MMSDKTRTSWKERLSTPVFIAGLGAGLVLRLVIGPGVLPFLVAIAGLAIALALPSDFLWKQGFSETITRLFSGLGILSYVISQYFFLALGDDRLTFVFLALASGSVAAMCAYKARHSVDEVRRFFVGSAFINSGIAVGFLSQGLFKGDILAILGTLVGLGILLRGLAVITTLQKEMQNPQQPQSSQ